MVDFRLNKLRVLVTDAHKLAGLGAIRSLGRAGVTVIAGYPSRVRRPASTWSRFCSGNITYPDPWLQQFEFRKWLLDQVKRGKWNAVLPVTEAPITAVAAERHKLPKDFLPIIPSDAELKYTLSKYHSTRLALSQNINCPRTVFISDGTSDLRTNDDLKSLGFPIIIKTDNYLSKNGVYTQGQKFFAGSEEEIHRILNDLALIKTPIIAQEVIPGHGTGAFLLMGGTKTLLRFAHNRLHEVPYTGGQSSLRESCFDKEIMNLSERLLKSVNYQGVAMVEFRRRSTDGRPFFLEINGRLWGSLALALHCGVDFPLALLQMVYSGDTSYMPPDYPVGVKCRNVFHGELKYLFSVLKAKSGGHSEPPPSKIRTVIEFFLLSLNPAVRSDRLWWTDPYPGLLHALGTGTMLSDRLLRQKVK